VNKVKNRRDPLELDGGPVLPHKDLQLPTLRGRPGEHRVPVPDDTSLLWLLIVWF
jgi:hypothetical protein